jgi:hypothetical protein
VLVIMTAALSLALFAVVSEAWIDGWLLYDGRPRKAMVTEKRAHGHRLYEYTVGEQLYTGDDQPPYQAAEPDVPYETTVYFSASRPWISGLRTGEVRVGHLPVLLMVLIGGSLLVAQWIVGSRIGDDAALRLWFPVGRSWWAIAAGYMGLFAMFCVPVIADVYEGLSGSMAAFAILCVPAPLAIVVGATAIVHLRREPNRHGWGRALFGLVMGTIFTLVLIVAIASHALGKS